MTFAPDWTSRDAHRLEVVSMMIASMVVLDDVQPTKALRDELKNLLSRQERWLEHQERLVEARSWRAPEAKPGRKGL